MTFSLCLGLLLAQSLQFQVLGEVVSYTTQRLEWAEIESMDRRFVDYTDIDSNGRFVFKRIPEGLYKLTTGNAGGRQQQRTIEVRHAFADPRGRVNVKIEIKNPLSAGGQLKGGPAGLPGLP